MSFWIFVVRHDVPLRAVHHVEGDDLRATFLHFECQEARRGAHVEDALAAEIELPQVTVDGGTQVPLLADVAVTGDVDLVVKEAIFGGSTVRGAA